MGRALQVVQVIQRLDDPVSKRADFYGHGVNLCARTEASAFGGQVVGTHSFKAQVMAESPGYLARVCVESLGPRQFKGISEPTIGTPFL